MNDAPYVVKPSPFMWTTIMFPEKFAAYSAGIVIEVWGVLKTALSG